MLLTVLTLQPIELHFMCFMLSLLLQTTRSRCQFVFLLPWLVPLGCGCLTSHGHLVNLPVQPPNLKSYLIEFLWICLNVIAIPLPCLASMSNSCHYCIAGVKHRIFKVTKNMGIGGVESQSKPSSFWPFWLDIVLPEELLDLFLAISCKGFIQRGKLIWLWGKKKRKI